MATTGTPNAVNRPPADPARPNRPPVHTVTAFTLQVKACLESGFANVWVVGEVSSLSRPSSGHLYFNLKDDGSTMKAVMWRTTAVRHRYAVRDGQEVIVRGRLSVYPPRGDYQFIIDEMHAKGAGAQEMALRRLKEKLHALGYFAPERKRRLPRFPRRIALVASPTGAAVRDMLEILAGRWPRAEVWVCGVRVQGDGAAEDIAAALHRLNAFRGVDVVILGRGGGSSDDLAAFNAEVLAHAIFASRIPVVSAIGHEVDITVADLVADVRAVTPTEAAMLTTPDRGELAQYLRTRAQRLHDLLLARFKHCHQRFQGLSGRRSFLYPLERLHDQARRLDDWDCRLQRAMQARLQRAELAIETASARLDSLSPLNVLGRGYSLTKRKDTGSLIRSVTDVQPGDAVEIVVQDGKVQARIESADAGA